MKILKASLIILCLLCFRTTGSPQLSGGTFFMETEEWRDIPGYKGWYQASSLGRVRSVDRVIPGGRWGKQARKGVILSQHFDHYGYLMLIVQNKVLKAHRLVLHAFTGDPGKGLEADHINGDKSDNRIENLEWVTSRENCRRHYSKKPDSSSRYMGVCLHKPTNKWVANIQVNRKNIYLGLFNTEKEASKAYNNYLLNNHIPIL